MQTNFFSFLQASNFRSIALQHISTGYFPYTQQNGIQSRKSNGQNKQVEYNLYIRKSEDNLV
jgi:hypothetical protein